MSARIFLIWLIGSSLAQGCGTRKDKDNQPFLLRLTIPASLELADHSYPTNKCLPVQLQTVDMNNQPIAMADLTVALNAVIGPLDQNRTLAPNDQLPKASVYADNKCHEETDTATLRSTGGAINLATVYILLPKPGILWLTVDYPSGMLRSRIKFIEPGA